MGMKALSSPLAKVDFRYEAPAKSQELRSIGLVGVLRVHSHAPRYCAARDFPIVICAGASRRKGFGLLRNDFNRTTLTTIDSRIRRSIARLIYPVEGIVR